MDSDAITKLIHKLIPLFISQCCKSKGKLIARISFYEYRARSFRIFFLFSSLMIFSHDFFSLDTLRLCERCFWTGRVEILRPRDSKGEADVYCHLVVRQARAIVLLVRGTSCCVTADIERRALLLEAARNRRCTLSMSTNRFLITRLSSSPFVSSETKDRQWQSCL